MMNRNAKIKVSLETLQKQLVSMKKNEHGLPWPIGFGDNTDLLWWNNVNNQFCQLTTRVS